MLAHDLIIAGTNEVMVAGGMESMSNTPYIMPKVRGGLRMGHAQLLDHMFVDGLEDAYDKGRLMGTFAEDTADRYSFSRDTQDAFAIESWESAISCCGTPWPSVELRNLPAFICGHSRALIRHATSTIVTDLSCARNIKGTSGE